MNKYENLYSKFLHSNNNKPYGNGFMEVQLHRSPFHSGLRIIVTDGYRTIKDIHCNNPIIALSEFKKQINLIKE